MGRLDEQDRDGVESGFETPAYEPSVEALLAGPPVPAMPAVILTSEIPWDLEVGDGSTWPGWLESQDRLAAQLNAEHLTNTGSGHEIAITQPQLVDAIRRVVELSSS